MTMRVDLDFETPLTRAERLAATVALGAIASLDRVRFVRGDRAAVLTGDGLVTIHIEAALAEVGVRCSAARSSLDSEEDQRLNGSVTAPERVRPLGR